MTYNIKPSSQYDDKARLLEALKGYKILDFRPVNQGDFYVHNQQYTVRGPLPGPAGSAFPRFIVEPLHKSQLDSYWE